MLSHCRLFIPLTILISLLVTVNAPPHTQVAQEHIVYLPLVQRAVVAPVAPFGVEINPRWIATQSVFARANELGVNWVRLRLRSWHTVQPTRDAEYNWAALLDFERELIGARIANLTPIVVIQHSPHWATKTYYDADNQPYQTLCGAIREDRFEDFARFMQALVSRYRQPPFNVQYWELGNEPDVDPRLVPRDEVYGCWGDSSDPFYGGEHYGNMLRVVTPAIKAVDPSAQVVMGGLMLDSPNTTTAELGKPENFLAGVLRAGAGASFDILAYHAYGYYADPSIDGDLTNDKWAESGGSVLGRAMFLRTVMASYGVEKPLMLNETGLLFRSGGVFDDYLQAQADHIVRILARAMAADIHSVFWYTLNGPGWHSAGLLDDNQVPRPAYFAYQHFIHQTAQRGSPVPVTDYGPSIEAYRFAHGADVIDVFWSREATPQTVRLPRSRVIRMYERDGAVIPPTIAGGQVVLEVGVSPVYVRRVP